MHVTERIIIHKINKRVKYIPCFNKRSECVAQNSFVVLCDIQEVNHHHHQKTSCSSFQESSVVSSTCNMAFRENRHAFHNLQLKVKNRMNFKLNKNR